MNTPENSRDCRKSYGKKIVLAYIADPDTHTDGALVLVFADGAVLTIQDMGRSCCEDRYMYTDDDLRYFIGSTFIKAEIRTGPKFEDEYFVYEIQFLVVRTSKGAFTVRTHNTHNGYYGGFLISCHYRGDDDDG